MNYQLQQEEKEAQYCAVFQRGAGGILLTIQ
jgi:hypothetical protein